MSNRSRLEGAGGGGATPRKRIPLTIRFVRGRKVLLDADLAALYGVETGALTRAVRRNADRFPADFMFQLSREEFDELRCRSGGSGQWGGRRYPPYAFTEHGVAMLSSVLRSARAVSVHIEIMRAFAQLRDILATREDLAKRLDEMRKHRDSRFRAVFDAIQQLVMPTFTDRLKIGFTTKERSGED